MSTPLKSAPPPASIDTSTIRGVLAGSGNEAPVSRRIANLAAEVRNASTAEGLLLSYLAHQAHVPEKRLEGLLAIFETVVELGHNLWPARVRDLIAGKDLLDLGCGNTFYGAVFRAMGAKSYLGVDQKIDLNVRRYRSRRSKGYQKVRFSVADAIAHIPGISYEVSANVTFAEKFDLVLMHTVTEHLADIDSTFGAVRRSLRPNGRVWFLHDNFYSWAGHHGPPSSLASFDDRNPEHLRVADWAHLVDADGRDASYWKDKGLNRIRLDELRRVTERHFAVESWEEIPVSSKYRSRLTPEIKATRGLGYTERELLTQHVVCLAAKSAV